MSCRRRYLVRLREDGLRRFRGCRSGLRASLGTVKLDGETVAWRQTVAGMGDHAEDGNSPEQPHNIGMESVVHGIFGEGASENQCRNRYRSGTRSLKGHS